MSKYIVKFKMENGKEGQTKMFSSIMAASFAELLMPALCVVESEIVEVKGRE